MSIRRFSVPDGRMVTLPADLTEGNGNTRVQGPETVDIDTSRIGVHARFIANRIKLGDLVEIEHDPSSPATAGDHLRDLPPVSAERIKVQETVIAGITTPAVPANLTKG